MPATVQKSGGFVRLRKFSSSFDSDFRNFVGGSEDLQTLPDSEGTKYN